MPVAITLLIGILTAAVPKLAAQSILDRSPNLTGDWIGTPGVIHFNFMHRFAASEPPTRKVSSSPTLLLAGSFARRTLVGFTYSSSSTLVATYPNEWEFFARYAPLVQASGTERGSPVTVGLQADYNLAADGFDGELSVDRLQGPVRLLAAARLLKDPVASGSDVAFAGAAILRFNRFVALAADAGSVIDRAPDEKIAWGVGLQVVLPYTPHGLSLQVTNANNSTLQGSSRGTTDTRFGFEFTVPITLSRYFGRQPSGGKEPRPAQEAPEGQKGTVRVSMADFKFDAARIEIPVGTTVVWTNTGQVAHTATAEDRSFDTGLIDPGQQGSVTFNTPGTFAYYCMPHPFMRAVVVVR